MVVFGSRPPMEQTHYLIVLTAFWIVGSYAHLFIKKGFELKVFLVKLRSSNLVLFFTIFYILTSFLSLVGLPILGAIKHSIQEDSLYIFKEILIVGETTLYSSVQSVFFLLQGYLVGLYIYGTTRASNQFKLFKNIFFALLGGWFLFIIVGYLDFFGVINLLDYHFLDGTPHRFTSFFSNSSWSSQYLAVTLPLLPIVLLLSKINKKMLFLMVFLIVVGEVALLLSMQRGAWLTYPPTLLMIWVTIYYVFARSKDNTISLKQFLKTSWLKIFVTIPLTVIISATLVYEIKDYRSSHNIKSATNTFNDVSTRMGKVSDTGNRKIHWPPAIKLFLENPIYGGGGDSFGWQYKEYFYKPEARYHNTPEHTLAMGQFGTAHNLYLQTLTGKGIFGLIFLLSFLFVLVYKLIKKEFFSSKKHSLEESILTLIVLGSLNATLIYANVQEIFYTQPVAIVFWIIIFIGAGITHNYQQSKLKQKELWNIGKYLLYFMLLLLPFHILYISYIREFLASKITALLPMFGVDASLYIVMSALWLGILSIVISFWIHRKVILHAHYHGLFIDDHENDKPQLFHDTPTPRSGGIGIFLGNLFLIFNPIGWTFIVASLPSFVAGLLDDFSSLSAKTRLLFQAFSALLAIVLLKLTVLSFGFDIAMPSYLGVFIAFMFIVGITNAINIIDGFNGLASGTVVLIFSSYIYVSWQVQDMLILELAAVNLATTIGFLFLNFPKGKIFLGDGGAFYLGFIASSVGLFLVVNHASNISQYYPLAVLIYPITEVLFSMYRKKILRNMSPMLPDSIHLHMLIQKRITRNNPNTSVFILKRVLPFMILSTYFYNNDIALLVIILAFTIGYIKLYQNIVRFKNSKKKF